MTDAQKRERTKDSFVVDPATGMACLTMHNLSVPRLDSEHDVLEQKLRNLAMEWDKASDACLTELNLTSSEEARGKTDTYDLCARQVLALIGEGK